MNREKNPMKACRKLHKEKNMIQAKLARCSRRRAEAVRSRAEAVEVLGHLYALAVAWDEEFTRELGLDKSESKILAQARGILGDRATDEAPMDEEVGMYRRLIQRYREKAFGHGRGYEEDRNRGFIRVTPEVMGILHGCVARGSEKVAAASLQLHESTEGKALVALGLLSDASNELTHAKRALRVWDAMPQQGHSDSGTTDQSAPQNCSLEPKAKDGHLYWPKVVADEWTEIHPDNTVDVSLLVQIGEDEYHPAYRVIPMKEYRVLRFQCGDIALPNQNQASAFLRIAPDALKAAEERLSEEEAGRPVKIVISRNQ